MHMDDNDCDCRWCRRGLKRPPVWRVLALGLAVIALVLLLI